MRYTDAVFEAGISARQGDHWRSRGWVKATAEGSGIYSEISRTEALIMRRMAVLVRAGMKPPNAANIARFTVEQNERTADLADGLRITFGNDTRRTAV